MRGSSPGSSPRMTELVMSGEDKPIRFGVNFLPNHAMDSLEWVKVAEETGFGIAGIAELAVALSGRLRRSRLWLPPTPGQSVSARA